MRTIFALFMVVLIAAPANGEDEDFVIEIKFDQNTFEIVLIENEVTTKWIT